MNYNIDTENLILLLVSIFLFHLTYINYLTYFLYDKQFFSSSLIKLKRIQEFTITFRDFEHKNSQKLFI